MMNFFRKGNKKDKALTVLMDHVEGVNVFDELERLNITWNQSKKTLLFKSITNRRKSEVKLDLNKVNVVELMTEEEITEKDKTVVGRAVIGSLLAGPLGAIIGGISGTGTKKKSKERKIAVIGYDDKEIVLLGSGFSIGMDHFFKSLRDEVTNNEDGIVEL